MLAARCQTLDRQRSCGGNGVHCTGCKACAVQLASVSVSVSAGRLTQQLASYVVAADMLLTACAASLCFPLQA